MKKNSKYFKQSKYNPVVFQKQLDESKRKIEKLRVAFDHKYQALEIFLTLIVNFASHDIKNSLHSLDGMVSTLSPNEISALEIESMKMCIDQMRDILTSFGEFSIKNDGKSFEIGKLLQSLEILHRPYLKRDKVEFSIQYINVEKTLIIHQDFQLILFMFNNMIINSLTALKDSNVKRLTIFLRQLEQDVEILVCDTGVGIPDENKPRVFEPYFTTKEGGTGVGLTHVQFVIETILKSEISIITDKIEDFITIFKLTIPISSHDSQDFDN